MINPALILSMKIPCWELTGKPYSFITVIFWEIRWQFMIQDFCDFNFLFKPHAVFQEEFQLIHILVFWSPSNADPGQWNLFVPFWHQYAPNLFSFHSTTHIQARTQITPSPMSFGYPVTLINQGESNQLWQLVNPSCTRINQRSRTKKPWPPVVSSQTTQALENSRTPRL